MQLKDISVNHDKNQMKKSLKLEIHHFKSLKKFYTSVKISSGLKDMTQRNK